MATKIVTVHRRKPSDDFPQSFWLNDYLKAHGHIVGMSVWKNTLVIAITYSAANLPPDHLDYKAESLH